MFKGKRVLGLIPARGGSKRLPRKNVLPFNGKPLIAWTIQAGLDSMYLDRLVVSTEDQEIRETSVKFRACCVIKRPKELASDTATSVDVALHALDYLADRGEMFNYLALMQPTSPLRKSKHIDEAFALMGEKDARAIIGVCETEHPVSWMGKIPPTFSMDEFIEHRCLEKDPRRQEKPDYQINGSIYLIEVSELRRGQTFFPAHSAYAYIMDREISVDIDTYMQFLLAEHLHEKSSTADS